jgi:hypothetical protein
LLKRFTVFIFSVRRIAKIAAFGSSYARPHITIGAAEGCDLLIFACLQTAPPLEHLGQPEDIARVVSFLVGPDSAWVNGQILRVNGGLV